MVNAYIFEEFSIYKNSINDKDVKSENDTCIFPFHGHVNADKKQKEWKYPRKTEIDSDGNELLYCWSNCTKQLFRISTKCSYHNVVTDRPIKRHINTKEAIISDIEPSFWCEVNFSKYGLCIMFIDNDGFLYLVKEYENKKIIVDDLRFLEIIPLKEGAILVGFREMNKENLVYRAILDHPLEQPRQIFIENYNSSENEKKPLDNIKLIWGSKEYPLVFAYNLVDKHHILLKYSYLCNSISSTLSLKVIWREKVECGDYIAKTVFIERTILEDKYYLVFHTPRSEQLKFVGFETSMFRSICNDGVFNYNACYTTFDVLNNVKSVIPMDFRSNKNKLFGLSSLFGFNFQPSDKLFFNETENVPTFSIVLSNLGDISLYFGFTFISRINIDNKTKNLFEITDLSSGISGNFDILALVPDGELAGNKVEVGLRCNIKIISDDLLLQTLIKLLIKITNPYVSTSIVRRIFGCDCDFQWKTLCNIIFGVSLTTDDLKDKMTFKKNEKILESPLSSVYKKIKLFQEKKNVSNNGSVHLPNLILFWKDHLKNRTGSPFNREEFSPLFSKGLIPLELLNSDKPRKDEFKDQEGFCMNINKELMYLLHCLFEELSLFQLLNITGCITNRFKDDILLPLSKMLGLQAYYEYYQSFDLKYNIVCTESLKKQLDEWETPPILLNKISTILNFKKLDKNDNYYLIIKKYFPLQQFTLSLYENLVWNPNKLEILRFISSNGINRNILPLLSPILSSPMEKFLSDLSNDNICLNLNDDECCLIERFDLLSLENVFERTVINFNVIKSSKKKSYVNVPATALPHGRNSVDDQKNMLENIHSYYKGKVDKTKKYNFDRETIIEKWKLYLSEYSNLKPSNFLFNWFFKIFSYDTRLCEALELLSLQIPPQVLLQRSSGAYPIDEESWDEFQRQRIIDAIQILYTNFLGKVACTFGSHSFDINLSKLTRPKIVSKVYEIASNTLLSVDFERFKELYFEISVWNDFYLGILESMKFNLSCYYLNKSEQDSKRKSWLFEQIKVFSSPDDSPFLSGFLFGISLNGFIKSQNNKAPNSYPIIIESTEIYRILQNDGNTVKTCSLLLGTAISALKTQNKLLFRLYLMHIPSILPNVYTKSLQISNFNQYSAIVSIGLLFAQTRNAQVIEILVSEFLRSISEIDDQASINPFIYSISVAISLGMVVQNSENIEGNSSKAFYNGTDITEILLSCIHVNKTPKFSSNIESSPNLENYTDHSGLKRFNIENELLNLVQSESSNNENHFGKNSNKTHENNKFSNSSKHFCSKAIDQTILRVPAILALTIMYLGTKSSYISNSIPIPFDKPEELINYRPETLIFMAMSKVVIEWDDKYIPSYEYIRNRIPKYLRYLPPDRTFPFPILEELDEVYSDSKIDERLVNLINKGELDWIHCIQSRIAILCGIIWGIGIVFSGKRVRRLKTIIAAVIRYIDNIPPIQIPLCLASAIRDKGVCSLQVTIDKWSKDLGIRVCLTSLSTIFSGDGDKDILDLIKYFRNQLLESSQFQWTSSTAISPYSAFSVPPIENVYSQLMAYNNALGFLFLSAGHLSFNSNNTLCSTFLLLATHPFYPKDASDTNTPGIIFQPLRYLFISTLGSARRAIIPKLVKRLPGSYDISGKYKGLAYKEVKYVPVQVELKQTNNTNEVKTEYIILPSVLPDWKEIKSITVIGSNYYPFHVDFENDKDSPQVKRLFEGKLWLKLREGCSEYSWSEAKYIIQNVRSPLLPSDLPKISADISVTKQMFFFHSANNYREVRVKIPKNSLNDEINRLFDKFSNTLVIADSVYNKSLKKKNELISGSKGKKCVGRFMIHSYIDQLNANLDVILGNLDVCHDIKVSPDIIRILRITYLVDKNSKVKELFVKLNNIFNLQMDILSHHIRLYYEGYGGTMHLSYNERKNLGVFLELNGMPQTTNFNSTIYNLMKNSSIDRLLLQDYKKNEEIISLILRSEFPMITSLGLRVLKMVVFDLFYKNRTH
ncbi:Cut4 Apc1p TSG24 family regulator and 26S proteasome regulatory complex [Cryptosporidium bovis]|uniref:Cut4 Apc1p TSG24 family regulator and 26S proteasome regulatory complex n=1 Tax=Cryptosporidium bovis TaxID=310047 RepID=UPI003519E48C|nr:Cut4 Apc1p TSG24 family regulator and 26S proteasome regulatory complex [Cryptosporidium bovis]